MKIVIAIPTFNRCEKLKRSIESIDKQIIPNGVELSLAISNSASTDDTESYLQKLSKTCPNISMFNKLTDWVGGNYGYLADTIPQDADWVWYMGDDDYLCDNQAIEKVCRKLSECGGDRDFSFLHVCQGGRSTNSGTLLFDNVFNLCNDLGYLEMFGWISSLVVRREEFVSILRKIDKKVQICRNEDALSLSVSAFVHSAYFLSELAEKNGAFYDMGLVKPQDDEMTHETRARWAAENMGERYLYVVNDLDWLTKKGLPIKDLKPSFFRYHKYHLWDRFLTFQLTSLMEFAENGQTPQTKASMMRFMENWQRLIHLSHLIGDPLTKKQVYSLVETAIGLCNLFIEKKFDGAVAELIDRFIELCSIEVYDFNTGNTQASNTSTNLALVGN